MKVTLLSKHIRCYQLAYLLGAPHPYKLLEMLSRLTRLHALERSVFLACQGVRQPRACSTTGTMVIVILLSRKPAPPTLIPPAHADVPAFSPPSQEVFQDCVVRCSRPRPLARGASSDIITAWRVLPARARERGRFCAKNRTHQACACPRGGK